MTDSPQENKVPVVADKKKAKSSAEMASSVTLLTSGIRKSIMDYRLENGRTYHRFKDGKYNFPNDELELERLDLVHRLCLLTLNQQLGIAPPCKKDAKVGRVLDVGTGTGIWAIQFAEEHPEADVFAIDLSAIQPDKAPLNVKFEVVDIEDAWAFTHPFQYIHCRSLASGITQWEVFLQRCFDNLKPGGYLELQESAILTSDDGTLKPEHALFKWSRRLMDALFRLGAAWVDTPSLRDVMLGVGFEDVALTTYKWPINSWPEDKHLKELGTLNHQNFMMGVEAMSMAPFTRGLGWSARLAQASLIQVRREGSDTNIHAYWPR
ncbi:Secondary metabolism regulator LAE1 [Colletotrichum spinosum]|uniref:Secondary metabolism regulator LAE1 n=1 Tax=Colletotrichum spinosum TaxID=1347390 RepID=A0A4R8Q6S0_9PEZI|nr:Secondary metabolism regulator LAE1 [Colletotrichum spinosum]